jgi:hypothetical protein
VDRIPEIQPKGVLLHGNLLHGAFDSAGDIDPSLFCSGRRAPLLIFQQCEMINAGGRKHSSSHSVRQAHRQENNKVESVGMR